MANRNWDDPAMAELCRGKRRLVEQCQNQQLEIHRSFIVSYRRDLMLRSGLCQQYNGGFR